MIVGFLCSYLDQCSFIGLNEFVNCRIDYWSQCLCLADAGMVGLAQVLCWFLVLSSRSQNYFCFRFPPKLVPFHTSGFNPCHHSRLPNPGTNRELSIAAGLVMQTVCLEGSYEEQPQRFRSMSLDCR